MAQPHLPEQIRTTRAVVRRAAPEDLPEIAAWPGYPKPYDWANMLPAPTQPEDGPLWWQRIDWADRAHYSVVEASSGEIVGVYAFCRINRDDRSIGNMGVRIRPDRCDAGLCQETLGPLLRATLAGGFARIRLDVAAPNARAVHCYRKCGMRIAEHWWREGQVPADPADPAWAALRPHLRRQGRKWLVRFYWMEFP